jgi:hypothetical protein
MARKDPNIRSYKRLKAKSANTVKTKDFNKQGREMIQSTLLPSKSKPQKQAPAKDYDKLIGNLQNDYNSKIKNLEKDYGSKLAEKDKAFGDTFSNMSKRMEAADKRTSDLSEGVTAQLKKLYESRGKSPSASTSSEEGDENKSTSRSSNTSTSTGSNIEEEETSDDNVTKSDEAREKTKETIPENTLAAGMSELVDEKGNPVPNYLVSKVFELEEVIQIGGNNSFRITNLYQPRSGANSVAGKKKGAHAKGVDVVSYDSSGNKTNYPIAVSNGKIMNVGLHGSGEQVGSSKSELGYYIDVMLDNDPTKMVRYGHLDPGIMAVRDTLMGSSISRGDVIFEGGKMTGSGTAPHVKIYLGDLDAKGTPLQNFTDKGNDPSHMIKYGA